MGTITRGYANLITATGPNAIADGSIVNEDLASTVITGATAEATVAGGDQILIYDDSASALRKMTRTNFVSGLSSGFDTQLFHVRDEKAAGTSAGTFTSGSFQTRTLNTVKTNEISGASLSSNQITLPSGTYYINASAPAYYVGGHIAKLKNITDNTDTIIGTSEATYPTASVVTRSFVFGRFTIAASKNFELQHACQSTYSPAGFGPGPDFSVVNVYAEVQIWKVA
jgi:hypothetical protein